MKKVIILFIVLLICFTACFSIAGDTKPTNDIKLKKKRPILKPAYSKLTPDVEKKFIDYYETAESNKNNEKVYYAILNMGGIYRRYGLDKSYKEDAIELEELKEILNKIFLASNKAKSAKDFLYKALFSYATYPNDYSVREEIVTNCNYVINNFPNSDYAEYAYLILGFHFVRNHKVKESIKIHNKYLEIYGKSSVFLDKVYYFQMLNYESLYSLAYGKDKRKEKEYGDIFLKFSNQLLEILHEKSPIRGSVYSSLSSYYSSKFNTSKKLEYDYLRFETPEFGDYTSALKSIILNYLISGEYANLEKVLNKAKKLYPSDGEVNKVFKHYSNTLELIKRFGYDDRINLVVPFGRNLYYGSEKHSKINKRNYESNKNDIERFNKAYDKCFDKDYNIIKPIKSIKIGLEDDDRNSDKKEE